MYKDRNRGSLWTEATPHYTHKLKKQLITNTAILYPPPRYLRDFSLSSNDKMMEIRKKPLLQACYLIAAVLETPYSVGVSAGRGTEAT